VQINQSLVTKGPASRRKTQDLGVKKPQHRTAKPRRDESTEATIYYRDVINYPTTTAIIRSMESSNIKRIWLIFSQFCAAISIVLAAFMGLTQLFPGLIPDIINPKNRLFAINESGPSSRESGLVSYADAAQRALPAVVNVSTSKEITDPRTELLRDPLFQRFFGGSLPVPENRVSSLGSGVIVSPQGYILTNHHVVEAADDIHVALKDGRAFQARLVGADPETDLAVLKIDAANLPALAFAPANSLRVGDVVLGIGNPFGVGQSVTMGIVSALGRNNLNINTFENFIQTDAAINPGNSGGALVDTTGNLVGINAAIFTKSQGYQGISFAIPVSIARHVMEQIIRHGSVTRGWIGVELQDITPELAESLSLNTREGALIAGVLRGAPADRAGLRPGDVVVAVNDAAVKDARTMTQQIITIAPGQTTMLQILRQGKRYRTPVRTERRPNPQETQER